MRRGEDNWIELNNNGMHNLLWEGGAWMSNVIRAGLGFCIYVVTGETLNAIGEWK
jgi:hypothetical protein